MAARGAIAKEEITNKILEYFPNAFINEKEIRIPCMENDEIVEIKFTLTCAKTNIGGDRNNLLSIANAIEPTEEEKTRIKELVDSLPF